MLIEEEEDGQIMSLGDSHIARACTQPFGYLSMLTVRVVDLEYS